MAWIDFVPQLRPMCIEHVDSNLELWSSYKTAAKQAFLDTSKQDWDWNECRWRTSK